MSVEKCSIIVILSIVTLFQFCFYSTKIMELSATKRELEAEIRSMRNKREALKDEIGTNAVSGSESAEGTTQLVLNHKREHHEEMVPPPIFFITPTTHRAAQKADLTRLGQTLAYVPNLRWIIVEDANESSPFIDDLMRRLGIQGAHLVAETPVEWRNKFPKGVQQRNTALQWIRTEQANQQTGIVFFGDDDNVYDWRLFDEMRTIHRIGIWPVGIVDEMIAESPILAQSKVIGFNSKWKRQRPFPIDMASFGTNISLILSTPKANFSYHTPRGYLESNFLLSLHLSIDDFEPKASNCTKVYVWHTRTEKPALLEEERAKFTARNGLSEVEKDAIS